MSERLRTLVSWSSGKDSAWSLHELQSRSDVELVALLTTVNRVHDRVAMHAVRTELLRAQAAAARLPLWEVAIPSPCTNEQYESAMGLAMERARQDRIAAVAFGDLFLEDIRAYREARLAAIGMAPIFPLWGRPTAGLARDMIAGGLRARITCVDPRQLPATFAGREFDDALLRDLPPNVDPCGERGEYHTFAYDGPMFESTVEIDTGEIVEREGFVFADMIPRSEPLPFPESLCHRCAAPPRFVKSARSTFILCPVLPNKYPPQPVRQCAAFRPR